MPAFEVAGLPAAASNFRLLLEFVQLTVVTAAFLMFRYLMAGQDRLGGRLLHNILTILQMKQSTPSDSTCSSEEDAVSAGYIFSAVPHDFAVATQQQIDNDAIKDVPLDAVGSSDGSPKSCRAGLGAAIEVSTSLDMHPAGDDLGSFWRLCQSLPHANSMSSATRRVLVDAVHRPGAVLTDASCAVDIAVACCDPELGDAALTTGIRLGCDSAWLSNAYHRLSIRSIPISSEQAVELMRLYGRENRGDLAVDFWLEVRAAASTGDDPVTSKSTVDIVYGAAIEACVSNGDLETAARAARSCAWRAPPCSAGQASFLTLARWLARRQDLTPALECYDGVRKAGGVVDLQTYRALLAACVRNSDMVQASELFHDLVATGLEADLGTFSAMIRGYCAVGNLELAMTLLHLLRRQGIKPDITLFNAILDGCCSRNMSMLAEQVLQDMEDVGVLPSNQTVATLVRLYGRLRNLERSLEIFHELPKRHGLEVSSQTFASVISVCLNNARPDLAITAFESMKQSGCATDARTYEALIMGCLRQGDIERAVCLIDDALGLNAVDLQNNRLVSRVCLQTTLVEDVLRLIGRRRLSKQLGEPLLLRLGSVGFEVSESLSQSLLRSADAVSESPCSRLDMRRAERQLWRDFSPFAIVVP